LSPTAVVPAGRHGATSPQSHAHAATVHLPHRRAGWPDHPHRGTPGKPHLTPLLIFNGIGANLELVFPFIEALDPDLEVIAFDVPGVGGSSTPRHPYRFPAWPS
jgi:pimeloyl-ACP methyl ester carboxylesterase